MAYSLLKTANIARIVAGGPMRNQAHPATTRAASFITKVQHDAPPTGLAAYIAPKVAHAKFVVADSRLLQNSLTAAGLWMVGDTLAQALEAHKKRRDGGQALGLSLEGFEWDFRRTFRMAAMGLCVSGPMLSLWYRFLHLRTAHLAASPFKMVATKCAVDQLIFEGPYLAMNFVIVALLDGKGLEEIKEKFRTCYLSTFKMDCCVWPPVQVINFSLVPVRYQTPFCSLVSIGWNCYLSMTLYEVEGEVVGLCLTEVEEVAASPSTLTGIYLWGAAMYATNNQESQWTNAETVF